MKKLYVLLGLFVALYVSAGAQSTSTQLFDYAASQPTLGGFVQNSNGGIEQNSSFSSYGVSSVFRVVPGAHITFASGGTVGSPGGQMAGSGQYPPTEYFADAAAATLVSVDASTYGQGAVITVPSNTAIHYARAMFDFNNPAQANFATVTLTTDTPYVAPTLPAPTITITPIQDQLYSASPFSIPFTSNNTSTGAETVTGPASIAPGGTITLTGANGTVVFTVTLASDGTYAGGTASISFNVYGAPLGGAAFAHITDTNITDNGGGLLAHGRECFTPVSAQGVPITATWAASDGGTGTIYKTPACYSITSGVLQSGVKIVMSTLTSPLNLCYQRTIINTDTGQTVMGVRDGFGCIQPKTTTLELSTLQPNLPGLSLQTPGQVGPAGPAGVNGTNGTNGKDGVLSLQGLAAIRSKLPFGTNLINLAATRAGYIQTDGTFVANSGYVSSDYIPANSGGSMYTNVGITVGAAGLCEYDQSYVLLRCPTNVATSPGTFTAPNDVAFFTMVVQSNQAATWMVCNGISCPSSYQQYGAPLVAVAPAGTLTSSLAGKNIMFLGDSITSIFQNQYQADIIAKTGAVYYGQIARPGLAMAGFFEGFGVSCPASSLSALGTWSNSVSTSAQPQCSLATGGTTGSYGTYTVPQPGQTLAQVLANVDVAFVFLGTNDEAVFRHDQDGSINIGAITDAYTAGTAYAAANFFFDALQAAKPLLRIVVVSPYFNNSGLDTTGSASPNGDGSGSTIAVVKDAATQLGISRQQQWVAMLKAECASRGIPMYNTLENGEVNAGSIDWLRDGVHPSNAYFNILASKFSSFLEQQY